MLQKTERDPVWEIENHTCHLRSINGLLIDLVNFASRDQIELTVGTIHTMQKATAAIADGLDSAVEALMDAKDAEKEAVS